VRSKHSSSSEILLSQPLKQKKTENSKDEKWIHGKKQVVNVSVTTDVSSSAWREFFCRVPGTPPAKCHSIIRPFCNKTVTIANMLPYRPQYLHSRWLRESIDQWKPWC